MNFSNFTSLPPEEEQQFVVFERQSVESSQKAMVIGLISGGILGLFLIVLYLTSEAPEAMHTDALDDDMTEEETAPTREESAPTPDPAPKADPAPAGAGGEAGAAGATGAAAGAEGAAGAEAPMAAPKPPKGATKAPPTALTK